MMMIMIIIVDYGMLFVCSSLKGVNVSVSGGATRQQIMVWTA